MVVNALKLKQNFPNRRAWGSYVAALQGSAAYPISVVKAVESGRAWFSQGAAQASNWLAGATRITVPGSLR